MNTVLTYVRNLLGFEDRPVHKASIKRDRTEDDLFSDDELPALKRLKQLTKANFPDIRPNNYEWENSERSKSKVRLVPIRLEGQPSTSTPKEQTGCERTIPIRLVNMSENGIDTPSHRPRLHTPVRPVIHAVIDDDDEDDDDGPEITMIENKSRRNVLDKASPKYYIDLDADSVAAQQNNEDDVIFVKKMNSPATYKPYKFFVSKNNNPIVTLQDIENRNIHQKENSTSKYFYRKANEQTGAGLGDSPKSYSKFKMPAGVSKPYKKQVTPMPRWMQPVNKSNASVSTSKNYFANLNGNARSALNELFNLDEKRNYRDLIKKATGCYKPMSFSKPTEIIDLADESSSFRSTQRAQKKAFNDLILVEKGVAESKEYEATTEYDPITVASINSSDSEVEVVPSESSTSSSVRIIPINTLKDSLRDRPVTADDWLSKLDSKYKKKRQESQLKLTDARRESDIISKVISEQELAKLERKLKYELTLPESLIEEVPPTIEIPELTPEQEKLVDRALGSGPGGQLLAEKFNLRIHRRDLQTLSGLNWLNDEVINFYMNLLMQRCEERNDLPKVYATNTFFYPKLMQSGQAGLKRWTRKVDIFAHDLMVIPVHLGVHWCLSIIDFQEKKILYLDSMGGRNMACLTALRKYLCDEHKDKKGSSYDVSDWSSECLKDIPQQMNGSDCGMFACTFAEFSCRRAPYTFTQAHMPLLRRKMALEILLGKLLL